MTPLENIAIFGIYVKFLGCKDGYNSQGITFLGCAQGNHHEQKWRNLWSREISGNVGIFGISPPLWEKSSWKYWNLNDFNSSEEFLVKLEILPKFRGENKKKWNHQLEIWLPYPKNATFCFYSEKTHSEFPIQKLHETSVFSLLWKKRWTLRTSQK